MALLEVTTFPVIGTPLSERLPPLTPTFPVMDPALDALAILTFPLPISNTVQFWGPAAPKSTGTANTWELRNTKLRATTAE